jgi:drug/metabolite transporter (DMT)-like permease
MTNWLLLLFLAALWSPSFLLIKIGLEDFPPLTLATTRVLVAAVILYAVLRARGQEFPRRWSIWRKFLVMGFFSNAFPFAMFSLGELYADSGLAAILNGTTPIFTVVLAHLFIGDERLTPQKVSGVLLGFGGILFLFLPELRRGFQGQNVVLGLTAFTLAAASYGVAMVYVRRNLRGLPPLVAPTTQLTVAAAYLLPVALLLERPFDLSPGLPAISAVLALAVFGTAMAFVVYYQLVERVSATFLSLVTYILPPIGLLLGAVFLAERPGRNAVVGCLFIIFGLMVVNGAFRTAWRWLVQPSTA